MTGRAGGDVTGDVRSALKKVAEGHAHTLSHFPASARGRTFVGHVPAVEYEAALTEVIEYLTALLGDGPPKWAVILAMVEQRLADAVNTLADLANAESDAHEGTRLRGKKEGVAMALDYVRRARWEATDEAASERVVQWVRSHKIENPAYNAEQLDDALNSGAYL